MDRSECGSQVCKSLSYHVSLVSREPFEKIHAVHPHFHLNDKKI